MNEVTRGFTSAFATGVAIQQILEIVDCSIRWGRYARYKKLTLKLVTLGLSYAIVCQGSIHVADTFTSNPADHGWYYLLSALIVSAATEAVNSVIKFLAYAKETRKAAAAQVTSAAGALSLQDMGWK